jgi:hypothetical protein
MAGLAVESGKTYEEDVSEYGVFFIVSGVLIVKARFVWMTKFDYLGLLLLLAVAGVVSIGMVFSFKPINSFDANSGRAKCLRCTGLHIGLVEASSAQCYHLQISLPGNLVIICDGSFLILLMLAFVFQATAQYGKNMTESPRWIDDKDVPSRLSLAWSRDKSKNTQYSHLTESLSSFKAVYIQTPGMPSSTRLSTAPRTPTLRSTFMETSPRMPSSTELEESQHPAPAAKKCLSKATLIS